MAEIRGPVAVFSGGGTGGHLYPSLALAEALMAIRPDVSPFFVGAERGLEARILPERDLDHLLLPVRGADRRSLLGNLGVLRALVVSVSGVYRVFQRLRPRLVVVTGGYAGGPAGIAAGLLRIPLALQEQNAVPGATTRLLARWARQIHVAFPEAVEHLPRRAHRHTRVVGNPVRPPEVRSRPEARTALGLDPDAVVGLVVGGSQGSAALNALVLEAVRGVQAGRLGRPDRLQLLWSTGPSHIEGVRATLVGLGSPAWVRAVGYLDDMPGALASVDLAVSRAGAMATSEFLAWGVPSVLVPLPTAAADHQSRNAEALTTAGAALHLPQEGLDAETLWGALVALTEDPVALARMASAARDRGHPAAAAEIARALVDLLPPPHPVSSGAVQ